MAGVSIWWATPARPESHFSSEELTDSERYNRPIRRVAVATFVAKLALLMVGAWLGNRIADGRSLDRFDVNLGWVDAATAGRTMLGAAVAVIALRLPAVISDGWFEFRFRRGIEGYRPLPVHRFLLTTSLLAAISWIVLVAVAGVGYRLANGNDRWPAVFAASLVVVSVASSIGERWVRRLLPGGERPLDLEGPLRPRLVALAERFGLGEPIFAQGSILKSGANVAEDEPSLTGQQVEPNACAVGLGPNRRVVLTGSLLAEDPNTVEFVVAHELTHLTRRHLLIQLLFGLLVSLLAVVVVAELVGRSVPWSWFDAEPLDPVGLPILAFVLLAVAGVARPVEGWLSRAQERSADAGAIEAVGPLKTAAARGLYLSSTADLNPPRWARLVAAHPSPPERLEFLARHRR